MFIVALIFKEFHDITLTHLHYAAYVATTPRDLEYTLGALLSIILTGIISDRILNGRCYAIVIAMCWLEVIYDIIMIFFTPH